MRFPHYVVYFMLMSFIGFIYETIALTVWSGRYSKRGFMFGPVIPIYGAGSIVGLLLFSGLIKQYNLITVFLVGFFASGILEYPTSYILEKLFGTRWWDYSIGPYNINGLVSLLSSLGFALAAVIIVYVFNPLFVSLIMKMNPVTVRWCSNITLALFICDLAYSVWALRNKEAPVPFAGINQRLEELVIEANPDQHSLYKYLKRKTNWFK